MKSSQRGFTLVEIMIAVTIMTMITSALLTLYTLSDQTFRYGINNARSETKLSKTMNHFIKRLSSATAEEIDIQGTNSHTIIFKQVFDSKYGVFLKDGTFQENFSYRLRIDDDGTLVEDVLNSSLQVVSGQSKKVVENLDYIQFDLSEDNQYIDIEAGVRFEKQSVGQQEGEDGKKVWTRDAQIRITFRNN